MIDNKTKQEALERLVALYTNTGDDDKLAEVQEELKLMESDAIDAPAAKPKRKKPAKA